MNRVVSDLYDEASALPAEDRAKLAGLLLETLDDQPDPDAEEAWAAEVERRMSEYRAGRIRTVSWQDVRARLHRSDQ